MYQYTAIQWIFVFFFYCFGGWCFESTYVSIKQKKLTNRGFIRGPFLPIYGSGATMMMVVSMPFQDNIFLTYLAGCVGATALEYVTGVLMEKLFKIRYWDYSTKKFNFQGHICLSSTLTWGFFTIMTTEFLQVWVEKVMFSIPENILNLCTRIVLVIFVADFALCFKAAIDLRVVLEKMYQAKHEMGRIRRRLDVLIAVTGEEIGNKKDAITDKMTHAKEGITGKISNVKDGFAENVSEMKESIEYRFERLKQIIQSRPATYTDAEKEELMRLNAEYSVNVDRHRRLSKIKDFIQRSMLRSNPGMTSVEYGDALEELKAEASKYFDFTEEN